MGGRRIESISFADDMVILADNEKELGKMLTDMVKKCKKYCMNISIKKAKI